MTKLKNYYQPFDNNVLTKIGKISLPDEGTGKVFDHEVAFALERSEILISRVFTNETDTPAEYTYYEEQGSSIGFAQELGASVTAEASVDIAVASFSVSATLSAKLTASQAFSKKTSTTSSTIVAPGKSIYIYTSEALLRYYMNPFPISVVNKIKDEKIKKQGFDIWGSYKTDTIYSGRYVTRNEPILLEPS